MDDQRPDREDGKGVSRPSNRFRMSLRVMLSAVTLFCLLCAFYRVHHDNGLRAELAELSAQVDDIRATMARESQYGPRDPELELLLRDAVDRIAEINERLCGKRAAKAQRTDIPPLTTQIARRLESHR